jgi:hypothetical protein
MDALAGLCHAQQTDNTVTCWASGQACFLLVIWPSTAKVLQRKSFHSGGDAVARVQWAMKVPSGGGIPSRVRHYSAICYRPPMRAVVGTSLSAAGESGTDCLWVTFLLTPKIRHVCIGCCWGLADSSLDNCGCTMETRCHRSLSLGNFGQQRRQRRIAWRIGYLIMRLLSPDEREVDNSHSMPRPPSANGNGVRCVAFAAWYSWRANYCNKVVYNYE